MPTITRTVNIIVTSCGACDISYGLPETFINARKEDRAQFFCPNGHALAYTGPSQAEREARNAKARVEVLERALANRDEDLRSERASHAATKGNLTKVRKRAAAGVCPCCQRTFQNVARHVAGQHPEHLAAVKAP